MAFRSIFHWHEHLEGEEPTNTPHSGVIDTVQSSVSIIDLALECSDFKSYYTSFEIQYRTDGQYTLVYEEQRKHIQGVLWSAAAHVSGTTTPMIGTCYSFNLR